MDEMDTSWSIFWQILARIIIVGTVVGSLIAGALVLVKAIL